MEKNLHWLIWIFAGFIYGYTNFTNTDLFHIAFIVSSLCWLYYRKEWRRQFWYQLFPPILPTIISVCGIIYFLYMVASTTGILNSTIWSKSLAQLSTSIVKQTNSPIPPFETQYWNGKPVKVIIPSDVLNDALYVCQQVNCDPYLLVAIAHSEHPGFNSTICSPKLACGRYQFIETTFQEMLTKYGYNNPTRNRNNPQDSALAAALLIKYLGLEALTNNRIQFIIRFAGLDGGRAWNKYDTDGSANDPAVRQAAYAYDLRQTLANLH